MGCGGSKKQDVADPSAVELDEPSVAQAVTETLEVKAQPAKAAEMMRQVSSGKIAVSPASAGAAELMRKMSTGKIELPPAEEEAPLPAPPKPIDGVTDEQAARIREAVRANKQRRRQQGADGS